LFIALLAAGDLV